VLSGRRAGLQEGVLRERAAGAKHKRKALDVLHARPAAGCERDVGPARRADVGTALGFLLVDPGGVVLAQEVSHPRGYAGRKVLTSAAGRGYGLRVVVVAEVRPLTADKIRDVACGVAGAALVCQSEEQKIASDVVERGAVDPFLSALCEDFDKVETAGRDDRCFWCEHLSSILPGRGAGREGLVEKVYVTFPLHLQTNAEVLSEIRGCFSYRASGPKQRLIRASARCDRVRAARLVLLNPAPQ